MTTHRQSLYYLNICIDIVIITSMYFISIFVVNGDVYTILIPKMLYVILLIDFVWIGIARVMEMYKDFREMNFALEAYTVFKTFSVLAIFIIIFFFFIGEDYLGRRFLLSFIPLSIVSVSVKQFLLRRLLQRLRLIGRNLRSIMIVGSGEAALAFRREIEETPQYGYRIVGYVDDIQNESIKIAYLGNFSSLDGILQNRQIDDVIVALPENSNGLLKDVIHICEKHTTRVKIIPDYFNLVSEKFAVSMFGTLPIISVREDRLNEIHWRLLKRTFDLGFSLFISLAVLSWLFPILIILIKLNSKGPSIYKQERWGRDNKRFFTYKFRSMEKVDATTVDENGKYQQAKKDDPRVTGLGRFLRKTNLDELPQFINVIKGEMSVIGPRPHPTPLNNESRDKIQHYMLRHLVKPGITGWAQVNGFRGSTEDPVLMQKRIDHDLWYIENWSFLLDIKIILLTIWKMFRGDKNAY